jgi:hypothetical protein
MNEDYVAGFMAKAAELGVDPEALLNTAQVEKTAILYNDRTRRQAAQDSASPDYAEYLQFRRGQPRIMGPGVTLDVWQAAGRPAQFTDYVKSLPKDEQKFWQRSSRPWEGAKGPNFRARPGEKGPPPYSPLRPGADRTIPQTPIDFRKLIQAHQDMVGSTDFRKLIQNHVDMFGSTDEGGGKHTFKRPLQLNFPTAEAKAGFLQKAQG